MTNISNYIRNVKSFPLFRKSIYTLLILFLFSFNVLAQNVIRGTVNDVDNLPLPGVSILVKSSETGTVTDLDGNFSLTTDELLPLTISISFLGFKTQEVDIFEVGEPIKITLLESLNLLNEVIVTGVSEGTSRKKLSFALTKIDDDLIKTVPATDASLSLRGKVAGLRIDQSGGNSGATVYLRGAKSISGNIEPLIVVDGFVTGLKLSDISPNDIESIEVVKGAAASALYGTRGEGGIIQVLTKKGNKRKRIDINIDNEVGFSNVLLLPPLSNQHHFKVNPDGSFLLVDNQRVIDYKDNGFSVNLHPYKNYNDNVNNIIKNNSYFTNSVSVSASEDKYLAYFSAQNQYKGGVADAVGADTKQNLLFNLGYKATPKITADITAQYSHASTPSNAVSDRIGGILYSTLLVEPHINLAEKDEHGKYVFFPKGSDILGQQWDNPLYRLSNQEYSYITENLLLGGKIKYNITNNLSIDASASLQNKNYDTEEYYPIGYKTISPDIELNNGNYALSTLKESTKNGQVQLNYNTIKGDFDWGFAAKYVYEASQLTGFSASGRNLTAPVKSLNVTEASTRVITSSWAKTINYGYFLNAKIGWKEKLFLDVLGRLDQSSRFGAKASSAFFPRASLAYRITKDIDLGPVNELKLRAAYGEAGSLPPFGAKDSKVAITESGGVSYTQNDNTNLKRAITKETEIGVDAILFDFLNVQLNYAFSNSINDFISVPAFAPIAGSANIYDNLGAVRSNSFEVEINGGIIDRKNFKWASGLTFSRVRSKITSLGDIPEFTQGGYRKAVGASTTAIYGYSIFSDLSQLKTNDQGYVINTGDNTKRIDDYVVNEFGVVVEKDALGTANESPVFYANAATGNSKIIGEASPDFIVGFTNTFKLGAFTIYGVLDWQQGGEKFNETAQYLSYVYRSKFTDESAIAGKPLNFTTSVFNASQVTDYWIENTTYLALRELSISYRVPTEKLGVGKWLNNANVSLIGRNLFILTNYKGVNVDGIGQDGFNYPTYRIISGKLTINF